MLRQRQRTGFIFIAFAIVIVIGLVLAFNIPPPEIHLTENEAQINFRSDRGAVVFSGECVTVSWSVENIQAVYLNKLPTVGQGEETVCVYSVAQPTLSVTTQDGTEVDYALEILILTVNPLANIGFLLSVFFLLSGIYLIIGQSKLFRWMRRLIVPISFMVLITLLSIEIVFRIYISSFGSRDEQAMYLWSREEINAQVQLIKPVPYLNYIANPDHPEHNTLGYRGEDIILPKPESVFRIVAIGGSTTYSTGTTPEESYPAFLQKILREDYGYSEVEVINGGMSGYSSWENLANFAFRVLELEPDMILIYAAVNDVVAREQGSTDCYRGENALRGLNVGRGLWVEQNQPLSPIALYRFLGINVGWMPNPLSLESAFESVDILCAEDPPETTLAQRVEANIPIYFERNMRNLLLLAQGNDAQPVLSTWAYYVDADRPDHWIDAINQHNEITIDLSEELDIPLYDLTENLPVNVNFWEVDGIHLVAEGTQEQARHYAQFLDERGLISP